MIFIGKMTRAFGEGEKGYRTDCNCQAGFGVLSRVLKSAEPIIG